MERYARRILEFERQLLQDRMQLQHLIEDGEFVNDVMIQSKIDNFQREIDYMERQLELLRYQMNEKQAQRTIQSMAAQKAQQSEQAQKKDLEQTIGKSLMGVFASILIFISLVLFATLVLPYFNDTFKMITMFLVSFAFAGVGLFKLKSAPDNKFFVALAGCGIGAVYISLLVTNMYFKVIDDILLYVLIAVWAVTVCLIARTRHWVFQAIGQAGIVIAVAFGCYLCQVNEDSVKFVALLIFYVVAEGAFYGVHFGRDFKENVVHHIANIINLMCIWETAEGFIEPGFDVLTLVVMALAGVHLGLLLWCSIKKAGVLFGVTTCAYTYVFLAMGSYLIDSTEVYNGIACVIAMVIWTVVEYKESDKWIGKFSAQIVLLGIVVLCLDEVSYDEYGLFVITMVLVIMAYVRKNVAHKYCVVAMLFVFLVKTGLTEVEKLAFGIIIIATTYILMYRNREQYASRFKYVMHVISVIFLIFVLEEAVTELGYGWKNADVVSIVVTAFFNIGMLKSGFGKNLITEKPEKCYVYNIINTVFMIACLANLSGRYNSVAHFALVLTSLAVFMVNAKNLLDKRDNIWVGIYVGIKLTVLAVAILTSYDSVNYVISITCFILAIVGIVIGFKWEYKSLRLYGLVLSMISTFKLIMVDMAYDNTLGNALSFFASGVLCFVISLIYNYIDGIIQKKE